MTFSWRVFRQRRFEITYARPITTSALATIPTRALYTLM